MAYLLDTNIISALVRDPRGRVADWIRSVGEANVRTSVIVAAELRFGATKRGSARLTSQLEVILGALDIMPFETPADIIYGDIRTQLERVGTPIGANDLLIAAHALMLDDTLVTDNHDEFKRVVNLRIENWLRAVPVDP